MAYYWVASRYDDFCRTKDCPARIHAGDRILIYDGQPFCEECGEELANPPLPQPDVADQLRRSIARTGRPVSLRPRGGQ